MAVGFRAVTKIKYGAPDGSVKEFGAQEPVTGLSKEAMRDLWDAGALEQYETAEAEPEPEAPAEGTESGGAEVTPEPES